MKSEVYCQLLLYNYEKSLYSMFDSKHRELITILIVISLMSGRWLNMKAFAKSTIWPNDSWRCKCAVQKVKKH